MTFNNQHHVSFPQEYLINELLNINDIILIYNIKQLIDEIFLWKNDM